MTSDRSEALARVLAASGFADAQRIPLAGDASTRRYERLAAGPRKAVLMDAPPSAEAGPCPPLADVAMRRALGWNAASRLAASRVEAFVAIAEALRGWGLSAPEIYAVDVEAGYAVLEDLGDDLFARVIPARAQEEELYRVAAHVLARVHAQPIPDALPSPAGVWPVLEFDALALEVNADLFVEWLPQSTDIRIDDAARARWERIRVALIEQAETFPRAFTIRDYHAENLLWLPARQGDARVGLLDFQDAVRGWRTWDFAMLLQDARRDVSAAAQDAAIQEYLRLTAAPEAAFREELAVLGALNAARILGLFARLAARDAKPRYLEFMPRMWRHLNADLAHPALGEMRDFVRSVARTHIEAAA